MHRTTITPSPPTAPTSDTQRLSKRVAAQLNCSRREAEQYITEGWVRIDGQSVRLPQTRVSDTHKVDVDPAARLGEALRLSCLLHQPVDTPPTALLGLLDDERYWSATPQPASRPMGHRQGLRSLLPIPPWASGLGVLSQDPGVLRRLTEEAPLIEQEWIADVMGTLDESGLNRLRHGSTDTAPNGLPWRVSWQSEQRLRFAVRDVSAEKIRQRCTEVGLRLDGLRRIRIGRVSMAGLPLGQWRALGEHERF